MGWDFGFGGAYWVQYWTQNYTASQFKSLCEYRETEFGTAYTELTAGVLNDLERIKDLSADDEESVGKYFVAEALSIFTWQILTDVWGDIPYSEALRGDEGIDSPVFDPQEDIYSDLLTRIDNLLKVDLTDASLDSDFDFVFSGDLDNWMKFANSLKLKLMLRLSETDEYNNSAVISFIEANPNGFLTSSSAAISGSTWTNDQEGKRHPMLEFEEGGASYLSTNVIGCKSFVDYLNINNDPRLDALFVDEGAGFIGAFFGDFDSKEDSDMDGTYDDEEDYCTANFDGETPLVLMSSWEVNFNIAEVYARAGSHAEAKEFYDDGVEESLAQHGIDVTDIIDAGGYAEWVDGTIEEEIKQISMQRWVAFAKYQHIEAFLERNRTKYPSVSNIDVAANRVFANDNFPVGELTVSVNGRAKTNGQLPASPIYPSSVMTRNSNAPDQKTDLLEKVWWNQKQGK
ncbi:SusD/RagB family nutrient-binding outer membrane lipoprotein [Thermophagus sp. OGC60D27]|uniref:SusD/RagB family nutrient-binding outer membrane lipoprotein n=1 Tax=Thermophagus sp. OGC60D27 TaxID=3458415 RepID=UPI004038439B